MTPRSTGRRRGGWRTRPGRAAAGPAEVVPLDAADGRTLAEPLLALTDLPAFPTSSIDGWAVRGPAPWRPVGRVLAGGTAAPLTDDGTCVEIATGAMVPAGAAALIRVEESTRDGAGLVSGAPRELPEWRLPGEEATKGEELLPVGTAVDPAVIGVAATCGYESLTVSARPRAALLVFGDELLTGGTARRRPGPRLARPADARLAAPLRRDHRARTRWPVRCADTLEAHVEAIRTALDDRRPGLHHRRHHARSGRPSASGAGRARRRVRGEHRRRPPRLPDAAGPADRPGRPYPLPGRPARQPAVRGDRPGHAGRSRCWPGWPGGRRPALPLVRTTAPVPGRGDQTHLALAALDHDGRSATPVGHVGSAMLRGLANAHGFLVVRPDTRAAAGDLVPFLPLPLLAGERP